MAPGPNHISHASAVRLQRPVLDAQVHAEMRLPRAPVSAFDVAMQKIIAITDIHITRADQDIIGLDPLERFEQVRDAALIDHSDAVAMVLMGDLTHHGLPEQYDRLRGALSDVPMPVIPMLGNHDRRDAFLAAFPEAPQTPQGHIQSVMDLPHHRIIALDTLDGPPYPKGHHLGRLCPARMDWLRAALDGAAGRIPLVFTHHPPFATGIVGMDLINLTEGAALIDLLAATPGTHLFCGHIHRTISGSSRGVPWTMFKSPCHQGVLDLTDPNSSLSIDEPPAYGLLLLAPDGVVAHSEDVGINAPVYEDTGSATH